MKCRGQRCDCCRFRKCHLETTPVPWRYKQRGRFLSKWILFMAQVACVRVRVLVCAHVAVAFHTQRSNPRPEVIMMIY